MILNYPTTGNDIAEGYLRRTKGFTNERLSFLQQPAQIKRIITFQLKQKVTNRRKRGGASCWHVSSLKFN